MSPSLSKKGLRMHHKYFTYVHMGECSLLLCGGVLRHVCGTWNIRDMATRLRHMYTYAHLHTCTLPHALFGSMINHGIFGSFREGSEKPCQLQKDFSILLIVNSSLLLQESSSVYHFFTIAVSLPPPHLSEVTKKSQLSCGYYNKSNISAISITE